MKNFHTDTYKTRGEDIEVGGDQSFGISIVSMLRKSVIREGYFFQFWQFCHPKFPRNIMWQVQCLITIPRERVYQVSKSLFTYL